MEYGGFHLKTQKMQKNTLFIFRILPPANSKYLKRLPTKAHGYYLQDGLISTSA